MSVDKRAKTPEQKRAIIERLYSLWLAHPHLRFGQFLVNATGDDLLYQTEDEDLAEVCEIFYERLRKCRDAAT